MTRSLPQKSACKNLRRNVQKPAITSEATYTLTHRLLTAPIHAHIQLTSTSHSATLDLDI
ncbi:hypothetical protein FEI14_08535 [Lacticaseibacillus zeae]|uniref:Alpha-galactosidase n=1 Tax=Lacticaseibacillus zeae TaxID=57037 RepID=A0A5R8LW74_LACZE|nr:hypothetical protein FEI14_08535 [Lacticaseibacillus zeae]